VSIVIFSEYAEFIAHTDSNLCNVRHQIVWYAVGHFTYETTLMRTDRIKIAEQNCI
jgi:hypothetical protein